MLPTWGSAGAAGYNLCVADSCVIPPKGKGTTDMVLAVSLPPGTNARIAPRLGLAIQNFVDVGAGIVNSDYWGGVKVVLFNHYVEDFIVQGGHRSNLPKSRRLQPLMIRTVV